MAVLTLNSFENGGGDMPPYCDSKYHSDVELNVALSTGWYNGGERCLHNITVSANGRTVKAKVVDVCDSTMGCDEDHDYQPPCANNLLEWIMNQKKTPYFALAVYLAIRTRIECDNQYHSDDELIVALSTGWYNGGRRCLHYVTINANGESVRARVVDDDTTMGSDKDHDYQPPCANNIVDASKAVWKALGMPEDNWDELDITWSDA
ncbi:unnamed protein product [Ilex paraguariensis]|uniref:Uncharacterized protein n=1 Tax=Ilex paraguariensis TaxID=185542 RepID=A0ABC8QPG6_9AQUA